MGNPVHGCRIISKSIITVNQLQRKDFDDDESI